MRIAKLIWRIKSLWLYWTWHPVRGATDEYRALIAAAVEKARARIARKGTPA